MLLRADMDALPFVINGEHKAIHACGHDAHCSMVLAAASNLKDKIKKGTLKILFQQGEETLKGALAVIDAGVLEDVDIAVVWQIIACCKACFKHLCQSKNYRAKLSRFAPAFGG